MRTRLVTAMTAAFLVIPLHSALADPSSATKKCEAVEVDDHCDGAIRPQHKCEDAVVTDHKCEKGGKS